MTEALGVPENLYETSIQIYDRFLKWVKKIKKNDFKSGVGKSFTMRGDFRISDYEFTSVKIVLGVEPHKKATQPDIISMINQSESKKTDDLKLKTIKSKTVKLLIIIVVPTNFKYSELYNFFYGKRNEMIETLSHELKHAYDHHKKLFDNPKQRAIYQGIMGLSTGVEQIDQFIHDIYYLSVSENLVRPSEIVAAIKNNKISKSKFLEFLKSNETYKNIKRISEFNLENFKKEILKNKKQTNRFLKMLGQNPNEMTDDEKVKSILKAVYFSILNVTFEEYKKILTHSLFEELMGFTGEKQKIFENFISKLSRYENNPEDFFKSYENQFHQVGQQMLRKIYKLYDMIGR